MAKQNINVGTAANDKKGDSLRAAFQKVNANFTELYTALGLINDVTLSLGAFEFTGSVMTTTDSTAIVIDQAVTVSSDLTVGGDILASNIKQVTSTAGLKQVYFDPATGQLVAVV
jgi:acyl-CoA thioesterase